MWWFVDIATVFSTIAPSNFSITTYFAGKTNIWSKLLVDGGRLVFNLRGFHDQIPIMEYYSQPIPFYFQLKILKMKYRESQIDKTLRAWFANEYSKTMLRHIFLKKGQIRGLSESGIKFQYPITAIAGKNGAGKSTILALASCAYHNSKAGFKLPRRRTSYYTFSDFFVQHSSEISPEGIEIGFGFALNTFKDHERYPEGKGIAYQYRKKKVGGKWTDYDSRLKKPVVFLGIERIVPHSERSQSRSYSRSFADVKPKGWEDKVKDIVGAILGKTYDEFRYLEHSKYSLPLVKVNGSTYSGFNMGAGENALFEIFSTMYSCGSGALLVIDEIELGLHAEAQRKFIGKLKESCLETHTQIICTTHSKEIFDCFPDDARFFIESINGKTKITEAISSEFAFSKMGAKVGSELDIFVEDEVARSMLLSLLPVAIRTRINIKVIGSATAIARQLAALYVRGEERNVLAVFDGDQRAKELDNISHAKKMAENTAPEFAAWINERIDYLPGETWPEAWMVQKSSEMLVPTAALLGLEPDALKDILEYGLQAGKHNEFFEIAKNVGLERTHCLQLFTTSVCSNFPTEFGPLLERIKKILS
jgi:predicted ATPase